MKSILIVEDENIIIMDVEGTLKSMGYAVDTALDGAEGIEKIKQKKTYDLILLNNDMPRMDGEEFYTKVLALNGDMAKRIVFTSGLITDFIKSTGNPFLIKPFSPEQIIEAVKNLTS
jgi:two-component system chemotaxis response regulator CheY